MIAAGLSSLVLAKKKTATLCFFQSQGSAPFILAVLRAARSVLCSLQSGGVRRRATSRHDAIESDERFFEQECGANESSAREEKKKPKDDDGSGAGRLVFFQTSLFLIIIFLSSSLSLSL